MGACNAGLTCFPQPEPVNGVCLTSSSVANIMGGGGAGGTDASGDSPLLLTDGGGANDGTGVGVTDGPPTSDAPVTSETGGGDAPATSTNLITNGNFSSGTTNWTLQNGAGSAAVAAGSGQLCITGITSSVLLTWPTTGVPGAALTGGASYTFSYMAMATVPLTVDAKVGETNSPYTADFETATGMDAVTATLSPFTHTFTEPAAGDTSAGIAFTIPQTGNVPAGETTVCFANVSLVQN
jgi:hypothetical protein